MVQNSIFNWRINKDSYNSRALKQTYQTAVKMTATTPQTMEGFTMNTEEGATRRELPLTKTTEFWVATVNTFGSLYEVSGTFVYSKDDKVKITPMDTQRCVTAFGELFPGIEQFPRNVCFTREEKTLMTCAEKLDERWREDK